MLKQIILAALLWLATSLLFLAVDAEAHGHNFGITTRGGLVTDCNQIQFRFDDLKTARGEQGMTISKSQAPMLRVSGATNGGVSVVGWDGEDYSVKACKAAGAEESSQAKKILDQVSLSFEQGRVTPRGPADGDNWVVYLIVRAPRGASLNLDAHNGPIGLRDVSGKITVETTNGPIGIEGCSGEIEARAQNGPITLKGGSGNLRVSTQNGPIHVELLGQRWEGSGLEARAVNGPLSLTLPREYQSGVEVEASNHSPFHCHAEACAQARKDWDDEHRRIQFGSSAPVVRMSTVNGPISIESPGARKLF